MQDSTDSRRSDGGFTIVELIVVVVIVSFLTFAASNAVVGAAEARLSSRVSVDSLAVSESVALVAQMLRLAGVAVLLFGAGFWYLVELHEAGRLDRFRLGHFLLLAGTYSLFFAVFAVLGSREIDAWLAVGIAAAVSYPLLVLHVATIVGFRFAATSVLPLAVLTNVIVVNGVYGGDVRSFVWLGLLCAVIAHLTLTYPRLARGQEARRGALERQLATAAEQLAPQAVATRAAIADARALLALHDPAEHSALREWVEHRLDAARKVLRVPLHLLARGDGHAASAASERSTPAVGGAAAASEAAVTHCFGCGERHAS